MIYLLGKPKLLQCLLQTSDFGILKVADVLQEEIIWLLFVLFAAVFLFLILVVYFLFLILYQLFLLALLKDYIDIFAWAVFRTLLRLVLLFLEILTGLLGALLMDEKSRFHAV